MTVQHHQLQVGGLRLHAVEAGQGAAVLLLHGFPDTHAVWRHQIPVLAAAGYRVIAPDMRGYGESQAPAAVSAYRLEHQLADALGVLDALGVREPVRVVGHDLGAMTGWLMASRAPERVHSLAALSVGHPGAYASSPEQLLRAWYMGMFQLRGLAEWMLRANDWALARRFLRHPELPRWIEQLSRPGRLSAALAWYRANLWSMRSAGYRRVEVPVLGVWPTRDVALTEKQMTASRDYVRASWRYERIEASHWLQLDRPEELNRLLLEWFRT